MKDRENRSDKKKHRVGRGEKRDMGVKEGRKGFGENMAEGRGMRER